MRFKNVISSFLIALAVSAAGAGLAQDKPPQEQATVNPEAKRIAQNLIEEALSLSHVSEIFDSLRRTLSDVYIPVLRGLVQGDYPGAPEADVATASALAKMLTFMDYLRKAGDELDVALSDSRNAMISDFAAQLAKAANASELADARRIFDLPATRKTLDAAYAMSKLLTGFSYEDSRTFSEFSAWARSLSLDISQVVPGNQDRTKPAPSGRKVLKAQAFMNDLMRISHLDEMVADAEGFARDVYAETVPASPEEREKLRRDIDQYEFMYNMQKAVAIGIAPSVVAASLTDEQLETLTRYLHSPAFGKAFDLLRDAVKSATAYTKEDLLDAQKAIKDLDEKSKLRSPEEREKAKAEWSALIDKWTETLRDRISPETRRGLEQSLDDLQLRDAPM
ncbi:MAG TPA: hypothetical protein VEK14_00545 [Rhodomicrobium sp.]|nr:hypothetical protein [Rhodomicrobium sp.]